MHSRRRKLVSLDKSSRLSIRMMFDLTSQPKLLKFTSNPRAIPQTGISGCQLGLRGMNVLNGTTSVFITIFDRDRSPSLTNRLRLLQRDRIHSMFPMSQSCSTKSRLYHQSLILQERRLPYFRCQRRPCTVQYHTSQTLMVSLYPPRETYKHSSRVDLQSIRPLRHVNLLKGHRSEKYRSGTMKLRRQEQCRIQSSAQSWQTRTPMPSSRLHQEKQQRKKL